MREELQRFWREPKTPGPPNQSWRDWLLVLVLVAIGLITILTDDGVWYRGGLILIFGGSLLVPWRREAPLLVMMIGFIGYATLAASAQATELEGDLVAPWSLLVLLYALVRWGSGRHAVLGLVFAVLTIVGTRSVMFESTELFLGSVVYWAGPVFLGITVRMQAHLASQRILGVRLKERHALARELHDTVAHHVSAITIQAQAGRAIAATEPASAVRALEVIEEESSRTLNEMRKMVGALRDGEPLELAPQLGLKDIERIALSTVGGPQVEIELTGDLDDLGPSVEAGLFRLAIEAITNARKHARRATQIVVRIVGSPGGVHLTVVDDGEALMVVPRRRRRGYGLIGMAERTKLLGGTFQAGPGPREGWVIEAALPRDTTTGESGGLRTEQPSESEGLAPVDAKPVPMTAARSDSATGLRHESQLGKLSLARRLGRSHKTRIRPAS